MKITIINHYHIFTDESEYIGRGSPLGNPFTLKDHTREDAIAAYRVWLMEQIQEGNKEIIDELDRLAQIVISKGTLNLRCYCAPKPCHGDVIKGILMEAINSQDK